MGVRESLLNTITSVADSDFVRIVTSAGASSKATVRNLFKGFESNLSAKSSLTTSDYIRVVGSDNESYKQSMNSVKSTLGVTALEAEVDALNNNTVNTTFASSDTSKYTLNNVRLTRRGSAYILIGEAKCISPSTNAEVNIVSSNMPAVFIGQTFVPAWGAGNASKDALGVHFSGEGIFLSYGTAGCYYEFAIPMFV